MKFIIKDDNDNKIYEREAKSYEVGKFLACKDCEHFFQHYTLVSYPTTNPVIAMLGNQRVYLAELSQGHCVRKNRVNNAKPDGLVCEFFELKK